MNSTDVMMTPRMQLLIMSPLVSQLPESQLIAGAQEYLGLAALFVKLCFCLWWGLLPQLCIYLPLINELC